MKRPDISMYIEVRRYIKDSVAYERQRTEGSLHRMAWKHFGMSWQALKSIMNTRQPLRMHHMERMARCRAFSRLQLRHLRSLVWADRYFNDVSRKQRVVRRKGALPGTVCMSETPLPAGV